MKQESAFLEQTRRERKKKELRGKLLFVSRRLFEANGYENTSVDEIADAADISRGTFFNYFPSKESVLHAIIEEEEGDLELYLAHDLSHLDSSVEKIYRLMLFWVKDTIAFRNTVGNVIVSCLLNTHREASGSFSICRMLVEEAQQKNEIDPALDTGYIAALLMGVYYSSIIGFSESDDESVHKVSQLLDVLCKGIGGPALVLPDLGQPV